MPRSGSVALPRDHVFFPSFCSILSPCVIFTFNFFLNLSLSHKMDTAALSST